jgi:hypothetical protein
MAIMFFQGLFLLYEGCWKLPITPLKSKAEDQKILDSTFACEISH